MKKKVALKGRNKDKISPKRTKRASIYRRHVLFSPWVVSHFVFSSIFCSKFVRAIQTKLLSYHHLIYPVGKPNLPPLYYLIAAFVRSESVPPWFNLPSPIHPFPFECWRRKMKRKHFKNHEREKRTRNSICENDTTQSISFFNLAREKKDLWQGPELPIMISQRGDLGCFDKSIETHFCGQGSSLRDQTEALRQECISKTCLRRADRGFIILYGRASLLKKTSSLRAANSPRQIGAPVRSESAKIRVDINSSK